MQRPQRHAAQAAVRRKGSLRRVGRRRVVGHPPTPQVPAVRVVRLRRLVEHWRQGTGRQQALDLEPARDREGGRAMLELTCAAGVVCCGSLR